MSMWMWAAVAVVTACGVGVIAVAVWLRREMPDVITRPRLLLGVGVIAVGWLGLAAATVVEVATP